MTALPRLDAYLTKLPAGIDSYPEAQTKASLIRHALEEKPLTHLVPSLPGALAKLIEAPPLVSSWIPTVHAQSLFLALADAYHLDDGAFYAWAQRSQQALFQKPLYRALAVLASPTMLLNGTQSRWPQFQRGSSIRVESADKGHAVLALTHPAHLYSKTNLAGTAGGIAATVLLSRARTCQVRVESAEAEQSRFAVDWT